MQRNKSKTDQLHITILPEDEAFEDLLVRLRLCKMSLRDTDDKSSHKQLLIYEGNEFGSLLCT